MLIRAEASLPMQMGKMDTQTEEISVRACTAQVARIELTLHARPMPKQSTRLQRGGGHCKQKHALERFSFCVAARRHMCR